jgi:hypothetical protein
MRYTMLRRRFSGKYACPGRTRVTQVAILSTQLTEPLDLWQLRKQKALGPVYPQTVKRNK